MRAAGGSLYQMCGLKKDRLQRGLHGVGGQAKLRSRGSSGCGTPSGAALRMLSCCAMLCTCQWLLSGKGSCQVSISCNTTPTE